jgi:serine/threonine-protein kinase
VGDSLHPTDSRFDTQLAGSTPASPIPDIAPGTAIGEYVVEAKVGEGGMGSVYAVGHPLIGKRAAIKVMAPHLCNDAIAVERFILEARSVNQIGHPNIVDVFAFGKLPDGRSYFIMEWLQGESLATRIARTGPLPLRETADLIVQIADALEAAHEKEVVHRDLKPDNVFLVPVRGRRTLVKLLDFGIAKLLGAQLDSRKTRTGTFVGTPGYTPPEQARGNPVRPQGDVYALGVTFYEMVTGRLPFDADNPFEIVHQHLYAPPPSAQELRPDLPEMLDALIRMMMAKDPQERPSLDVVTEVVSEWRDELRKNERYTPLGVPVGPTRDMTPVPIAITPAPMAAAAEATSATPVSTSPAPDIPAGATPLPPPLTPLVPEGDGVGDVRVDAATTAPAETTPTESSIKLASPRTVTPDPRPVAAPWPGKNTPSVAVEVIPVAQRQRGRIVAVGAAGAVVAVSLGLLALRMRTRDIPAPPPPKPAALTLREPTTAPAPKPAPVPPPAAQLAELVVHANAPRANFALDGKPLAQATNRLHLTLDLEGPHKLVVTAPKRQPYAMTVYLRRGGLVEVNAELLGRTLAPRAPRTAEPKSESKNYVLDPFRH